MINDIQSALESKADKKDKISSENYLKGATFRGLKMQKILEVYKTFKKKVTALEIYEMISLAIDLIKSGYFEDKRVGIQILADNVKFLNKKFVEQLFPLFDLDIYEWATCDVLSSKVISKLILKDESLTQVMLDWSRSDKLWAKRASIISFVNLATKGNYDKIIIEICTNLIKNDYRFIQLGVGWCLRNLGQKNLKLELEFIKKNYKYFSREGLRYAAEKMKPELRTKILKNEF